MDEGFVDKINKEHGFRPVQQSGKKLRKNTWENEPIRLRITRKTGENESDVLLCETIAPYKPEVLHLVIPGSPGKADLYQEMKQVLIKSEVTSDKESYRRIVAEAGQLAAIYNTNGVALQDILVPFPNIRLGAVKNNPDNLEILITYLKDFHVVQAQTTLANLAWYVRALGIEKAYFLNPGYLANSKWATQKFFEDLNELNKISGLLIAIDLTPILPEKSFYQAVLAHCAGLNLFPADYGARLILYQPTNGRMDEIPLPALVLPNIIRAVSRTSLEEIGLQPNESNLATITTFLSNHSLEEAISLVKDTERLLQEDGEVSESFSLHRRHRVPRPQEPAEAKRIFTQVRQMMSDHVVGHAQIQEELSRKVCQWFLLGVRKPLILAFVGPTGTGKNWICEVLAAINQFLFKTPVMDYVPFEASSIVSDFSLSQLRGVDSGLEGANAKGILEKVMNGSVLAFNEVEKVRQNSTLPSYLISLLDKGSFRNGHNSLIFLPRIIIVLTMNAGSTTDQEISSPIGFQVQGNTASAIRHYRKAYEQFAHPALRGRINNNAYFLDYLTPEDLKTLGRRELMKVRDIAVDMGIPWEIPDIEAILDDMVAKIDPLLGARQIVDAVEVIKNEVFDNFSEK